MKTNTEIWTDCYGYEGLYEVSDMGNMRNVKTGRVFSGYRDAKGYVKTTLTNEYGQQKTEKIHRMVLLSFKGLPEDSNKTQVNHINEIKHDNRLENLEWMTAQENCNWGTRIERASAKTRKTVSQYTMDGEWIATYCSLTEAAAQIGIRPNNISLAASGKRISTAGYKWRYGDAKDRLTD